jgi:hypothetical protein
MPYPTCSHRKDDGVLCGSPALHGGKYCYFHTQQLISAYYGARARRGHSATRFALPPLDDLKTINHLLWQVANAIASDTIDYRRADAMLTALKMASAELHRSMKE